MTGVFDRSQVRAIRREGAKAAKCGLFIDPPEIRFKRMSDKKLVIDPDCSDDETENDAEPGRASSSKRRAGGQDRSTEENEDEDSENEDDEGEEDSDGTADSE